MKFSVNWLREFVDLPEKPGEIADLLTRAGVETENIETRGANDRQSDRRADCCSHRAIRMPIV